MKHRATARFWKFYDSLTHETQIIADKNFELLKANPRHPSLHFKNIRDDLWSARIGIHYRSLALKNENGFDWIWIGSHQEYDRIIR